MSGADAAFVAGSVVTVITAVCGGALFLFRAGGNSGRLASAVKDNTAATQALTTAAGQLREEFAAHRAATDVRLGEHDRMLIQHDKRISGLEQR